MMKYAPTKEIYVFLYVISCRLHFVRF